MPTTNLSESQLRTMARRMGYRLGEQRVNLVLWLKDGALASAHGRGRKLLPSVDIGRTDSERGLGFLYTVIENKKRIGCAEFVIDRVQVERLRDFLTYQLPRLKSE
jgi:hypothetical protein